MFFFLNWLLDVIFLKGFVVLILEIWYFVGEGLIKFFFFLVFIDFVFIWGFFSLNGGEDFIVDFCDFGVICFIGWEFVNKLFRLIWGVNFSVLLFVFIVISLLCIFVVLCIILGIFFNLR